MTEKKKVWTEPELIVIVRNRPEEAVLVGCKDWMSSGTGPSSTVTECCTTADCTGCPTSAPS